MIVTRDETRDSMASDGSGSQRLAVEAVSLFGVWASAASIASRHQYFFGHVYSGGVVTIRGGRSVRLSEQ